MVGDAIADDDRNAHVPAEPRSGLLPCWADVFRGQRCLNEEISTSISGSVEARQAADGCDSALLLI